VEKETHLLVLGNQHIPPLPANTAIMATSAAAFLVLLLPLYQVEALPVLVNRGGGEGNANDSKNCLLYVFFFRFHISREHVKKIHIP
jgi:hypothetical protein